MEKGLQHLLAQVCTFEHGPAASVQQPPVGRLPVPELAKRGIMKAQQLHHNGKARDAWGTGDKASDGPAAHQDHACCPQQCLAWPPSPMAMVATATCSGD
jgi:hypothetical protein